MECPKCGHKITFINTFKILNPHKFKCFGCALFLSLDNVGLTCFYIFSVLSLSLLGLYAYAINLNIGSEISRAGIFWGIFVPLTAVYYISIFRFGEVINANKT